MLLLIHVYLVTFSEKNVMATDTGLHAMKGHSTL